MKLAICHDFFENIGGGETEMKMLAEGLQNRGHEVVMYTGYFRPKGEWKINVPVKEIGMLSKSGPLKRIEMMVRFSKLNLNDYDAVISENYWSSFVNHHNHIHHCEAPIRQFYDLRGLWSMNLPLKLRIPFNIWADLMIPLEQKAISKCKKIVANSEFTKTRIDMYYKRDSVVIYPPVVIKNYKYEYNGDFWLYVGRLDYNKRIELMIRAFAKAEEKLKVIGNGPLKGKWFANGIEYLGYVPEDKLIDYYSTCKAVVYLPMFEDFGQVPVEGMASGKPCLGVPEGGLLETIIPKKTGWLIYPREEFLAEKIISITNEECKKMKNDCIKQAKRFDIEKYLDKWEEIL